MQLFLDTANINEIKKYASWGIIDGVTTNPSLIAREGVSLETRIKEIAEVINGPISAEVTATDAKEMLEEGKKYAAWHNNVYVKVPATPDGIRATTEFYKEGINTNVTLVFSLGQALLAAKAGATLVSPFVGRLDDISEDGMELVQEMVTTFSNYEDFHTKILVASVRSVNHVMDAAKMGAHVATVPAEILDKLIHHPLTDKGLRKFQEDWEKVKDLQK